MITDRKAMGFVAYADERFFGDAFWDRAKDIVPFSFRAFRDAEDRDPQPGTHQYFFCGICLADAAVNQNKVRQWPTTRFRTMCEPPLQHFRKHANVVGLKDRPDLELPVFTFTRLAVFEY